MDREKIKKFINTLKYDLATIQNLRDFGRIKETLPLVQRILEDITAFKNQPDHSSPDFTAIFDEQFWNKPLSGDIKLDEIRKEIKNFSNGPDGEEHLLKMEYLKFLIVLQSWIYKNISSLKERAKSTKQKKIEYWALIFACVAVFLSLAFFSIRKADENNWGLRGDFYEGMNFEKHITSGINKTIDFNDYLSMNNRLPEEDFSARWQGYLLVPQDGEYTFYLFVDDGVRLFIDNIPLVNEWYNQHAEFANKIVLTKGAHQIKIEYYNHLQAAILELSWATPGGDKEIIPERYLRQHKVKK